MSIQGFLDTLYKGVTSSPCGFWHHEPVLFASQYIPAITYTKFFGLTVNTSLTWKNHIDLLTKNLSNTCYLIQNIKPYLSISALRMIYHSFFHSIMSYGIMFWGNSPHCSLIFKMQKRIISVLMGIRYTLIAVYFLFVIVCCPQ